MKMLVCVKAVPVDGALLRPDDGMRWIETPDRQELRMNRYDEFALEEALRIKEAHPPGTIDVVTVGAPTVRAVIRRALAMGADNGIHVNDPTPGWPDARRTAGSLQAVAAQSAYDLVFTGVMAEDDMQSLVGPLLAARLDLPCATAVTRLALDPGLRRVEAQAEIEGGQAVVYRLPLPALLTIQSSTHRPRYPSLSNMLRARSQALRQLEARDLEEDEPVTSLASFREPAASQRCRFLEGSAREKAEALLTLLREKALLKTEVR